MAKDITVDTLTIGNRLQSKEVKTEEIYLKKPDGSYTKLSEALANIPSSWAVDSELKPQSANAISSKAAAMSLGDYTELIVHPTDAVIAAETAELDEDGEETGFNYAVDVPAGMIQSLQFDLYTKCSKCDVIIDWGDGTVLELAKATPMGELPRRADEKVDVDNEAIEGLVATAARTKNSLWQDDTTGYAALVVHHYATPGFYHVRVYGRDYFGIRTNWGYLEDYENVKYADLPTNSDPDAAGFDQYIHNQVCSVVKVASTVTDLSNFIPFGKKLVSITWRATNSAMFDYAFSHLMNLIKFACVGNTDDHFSHAQSMDSIFANNINLTTMDHFRFPASIGARAADGPAHLVKAGRWSLNAAFWSCTKLNADIIDILPVGGFQSRIVQFSEAGPGDSVVFGGCNELYCSDIEILANILWRDTSKIFNGHAMFKDTLTPKIYAAYASQIPASWGGTAAG